jgi:hypothetical protein
MKQPDRTIYTRYISNYSILVLLSVMLLITIAATSAQSEGRVITTSPNVSLFPEISFLLETYHSEGGFITDLTNSDLVIIENDETREVQLLEQLEPGLQVIFALNAAPIWATSTAGISHAQQIMLGLKAWAQNYTEETGDDFSLATNNGLMIIRSDEPEEWLTAIDEYQPDLLRTESSIVSLSQALDLATDPNPRPNMKRAILYITAIPNQNMLNALPNLSGRARQLGVRVFVWFIGPENQADTPGAEGLKSLAKESGGEYFHFSGTQSLPDPNDYFESLRYIYRVTYRSAVDKSGANRVRVEVNRPDLFAASRDQVFTLKVLPPNPIFLSPPSNITRKREEAISRKEVPKLAPDAAIIQYLVEFPDGYSRELVAVRLYIDGELAVEQTQGPFERFQWSLVDYERSDSHILQVEVEDELGLVQKSIETTVQVEVEPIRLSWWEAILIAERTPIYAGLLLSGITLILVLTFAGRKTADVIKQKRKNNRSNDPLLQVVPIRQERPSNARQVAQMAQSPTWPRALDLNEASARLVRISENGHPIPSSSISLARKEITFGSDPQQAITVLESPSIDPLHARLYHASDDSYKLFDACSTAGTWVNYAPVSAAGMRLQHGDLVHIGRIAFRFELSQPEQTYRPIAVPYQEE